MEPKTLKENAFLICLKISKWTGATNDEKITKEVEASHNAKDAGRFTKILIDNKARQAYQKASRVIREWHYKNTLPWDDNGWRLIKVTHYLEYITKMNELTNKFNNTVNDFIIKYDDLVLDAKERLN